MKIITKIAFSVWVLCCAFFSYLVIGKQVLLNPDTNGLTTSFVLVCLLLGIVAFLVMWGAALWSRLQLSGYLILGGLVSAVIIACFVIPIYFVAKYQNENSPDSEFITCFVDGMELRATRDTCKNLSEGQKIQEEELPVKTVQYTNPPATQQKKLNLIRVDVPDKEEDIYCISDTAAKLAPIYTKIENYKKKHDAAMECYEDDDESFTYCYHEYGTMDDMYDDWKVIASEADVLIQVGCYNSPDVYE